MVQLNMHLQTFTVAFRQTVNSISCDNEWRDRFIDRLAFEEGEIAHEAYMEELCIYHGHTEAEILAQEEAMDWREDDYPKDWPDEPPESVCPVRFTDFDALECWSGNCHLAAHELLDAMRTRLSEPPMPMPVLRKRFTWLRLWCWLTGQQ